MSECIESNKDGRDRHLKSRYLRSLLHLLFRPFFLSCFVFLFLSVCIPRQEVSRSSVVNLATDLLQIHSRFFFFLELRHSLDRPKGITIHRHFKIDLP
ncbi:hypothetical protein CSUI_004016 [Cystoisospora suis]|uniref:Transmembrane protein n=1 Tax=Cystoisospora suis TaxID=483139 RepID=A0A2C6KDK0_9APIC|nr:hypothetical protein CSUI_004016 [Cystoisospora suis]